MIVANRGAARNSAMNVADWQHEVRDELSKPNCRATARADWRIDNLLANAV
jgi:hypothetical protein